MAKAVAHTGRGHAELPPSSAYQWMICWGWRRTVAAHRELYGEPPSSAAAEEGTKAHEAFEKALLCSDTLAELPHPAMGVIEAEAEAWSDYVLENREELDPSSSHFDPLVECLEWVDRTLEKDGLYELIPETRVDFGDRFGFVGLKGTVDLTMVGDSVLHIADLKFGKWLVELRDSKGQLNKQLGSYLSGAIDTFGERGTYKLSILQPRASHPEGPFRTTTVSKAELVNFRFDLENAIEANYQNHPCTPGPHCAPYCPALSTCKARRLQARRRFEEEDI